jgi:hypothetical protein
VQPILEEVTREIFLGKTPQDHLELVARVYRSKFCNLHDRLIKKKHFGEVLAYVATPHVMVLLILL